MKNIITRTDAEDLEVDVSLGDKIRAEREMVARGYGTMKDNAMTWMALATWRACIREGLDVPADFDDFIDSIDDIRAVKGTDAAPFPTEA